MENGISNVCRVVSDSFKTNYHIGKDKADFYTAYSFGQTFYLLILVINLHLIYIIFHVNDLINVVLFICDEHFHTLIKKLKNFCIHCCKFFLSGSGELLVKLTSLLRILKDIDCVVSNPFKVNNNMEKSTNSSGIGKRQFITVNFYKIIRNLAA